MRRVARGRALAAVGVIAGPWGGLAAQDVVVVEPGAGVIDAELLRPFDAEYVQAGVRLHVRLSRTEGARPTWDFVMTMPSASGVGAAVDHLIHGADDLALVGRRFGFGAWRDEYVEAGVSGAELRLHRLVRDGDDVPPARVALDGDLIDGTFLYWTLGLLPLEAGRAYRYPTWSPTETGLEVRDSGVLTVEGEASVSVAGARFTGRIVAASTPRGTVEMLVSPHPPYLLRQELVADDGSRTTLLELASVAVPADPAHDRSAIAEAGAAFSRAYLAGDTAAIRGLYTGHATLLPPDREVRGGDAVVRYFAPVPGRTIEAHRMESEELELFGDVAIDVGTWHQTARRGEGPSTTTSGRYLIQWVRGVGGRWFIHRDMWHRPRTGGEGA